MVFDLAILTLNEVTKTLVLHHMDMSNNKNAIQYGTCNYTDPSWWFMLFTTRSAAVDVGNLM